jgi:hypothetical protein
MIELTSPNSTPHKIVYLNTFLFENRGSKDITREFLFGLQNVDGEKFIVLKKTFEGITWGRVSVVDLPRQNLYVDEYSKGLEDFLKARLSEGFKIFAFELSQTKEYLLWLAE